MKRLVGVLLLLVLLIPAATAATIGISPDAIAPGDTVTVSVNDLPDGAVFWLGIRGEFAAAPGEAFAFAVRDLTLPFSLTSGEVNAYTRGTTWTELSREFPNGGSVILRNDADANGEVLISQPRNTPNGTSGAVTLQGEAAAASIVADLTMLGTKQGSNDGAISFAIAGIEQGTVTVTAYVDGVEALSRAIPISSSPMPTPTPPQTPAVPGDLDLTSNKDTVVRGNPFTVTITGESGQDYFLTIENPGAQPPTFRANQVGVTPTADANNVTVRTTAAGTRSVELTSTTATRDASYTLRVTDPRDPSRYDEVRVRVEKGTVTITTSGTGTYYLGEEITLSGTNTDNDTVYLFMTGPNLSTQGVHLLGALNPVVNGSAASFVNVDVEADDTWSYRWVTNGITRSLDSGGYTIYAVSAPRDRDNLANVEYATRTIQLRPGFVTATMSSTIVAKGDDVTITGTAQGNPANVRIWIFGPYYYGGANGALAVQTVSVESDGTFDYDIVGTENLVAGQYFVVVQHPMGTSFEVAQGTGVGQNTNSIYRAGETGATNVFVANLVNLQAVDAANALINALESPFVNDIYTKCTFTVVNEFLILIDPIGDRAYGETFMITGATGYPPGTMLHYWIVKDNNACALLSEVVVTDGGVWRIDLDTTEIGPGAFTLWVMGSDSTTSATAVFDVYDEFIHPVPPGGATYRVERISVTPSYGNLTPGTEVVLYGTIRTPWAGYDGNLEFSTDLENPLWSCTLERDRVAIYTKSRSAGSITLTAFELDYGQDILVRLSLSGTVPPVGTKSLALLRILERDGDGRIVPNSEHLLSLPLSGDDPAPPFTDTLTLSPGWNFVSVPRPLAAGNDTTAIFAGVDVDGHSAFRYDTANRSWINLKPTDRITPLNGIWIYSTVPATVPLNFSTDSLLPPSERALSPGWNTIGVTGTAPATARDALYSVNTEWTTLIGFDAGTQAFETGIVNGGSGVYADTRSVSPGRGYWLYMTGPGTLCAIGA